MLLTLLGTPSVYPGNSCTTYVFQIPDPSALLPAMTVLDMDALLSFHYDRTTGLFTLVQSGGANHDSSSDPANTDGPAPTSRPRPTDGPVESECFYCDGLGDCAECEGTGYVQCGTCFGGGNCRTCGGLGYRDTISHGEYIQRDCSSCNDGNCRKCDGEGEVQCSVCRGNRSCTRCGGDGYR